jgi:hypothetical protein
VAAVFAKKFAGLFHAIDVRCAGKADLVIDIIADANDDHGCDKYSRRAVERGEGGWCVSFFVQ